MALLLPSSSAMLPFPSRKSLLFLLSLLLLSAASSSSGSIDDEQLPALPTIDDETPPTIDDDEADVSTPPRKRTCAYDFMSDVIQFSAVGFHQGDPLLTVNLSECTYFNHDISCCSPKQEETLINIIRDTQDKIYNLKTKNDDQKRTKMINGRYLAVSERLAEKEYLDTPILSTLDDALVNLFFKALETQETMNKTFKDPAFAQCLDELAFTVQDFTCALCSPAVGEASSIPNYLFVRPTLCKNAFEACHEGFKVLREDRNALTALYREVRLAAMAARHEEEDTQQEEEQNTTEEEEELDSFTTLKGSSSSSGGVSLRRLEMRKKQVKEAERDTYYSGFLDPLVPPQQAVLKDEYYGEEDSLESFCRHYLGNVSPLHLVNLLKLERSYAADVVLLAEKEGDAAIEVYDKARQTLVNMVNAGSKGAMGKNTAFIQINNNNNSVVEDNAVVEEKEDASENNSVENAVAEEEKEEMGTAEIDASGSSSSSSSGSATTTGVLDPLSLDSSYGLLHRISSELSLQDRAVFSAGFSSLIDKLTALSPHSPHLVADVSDEFFTREYYSRSTPHFDSHGSPCTAGPKREICFFPMDQTPYGTFEEIASGEYVVSSSTCASGEGDYGWCWTESPISHEEHVKGRRRSFALCNESCRNARAFFVDEPLPRTAVKTPSGTRLLPVTMGEEEEEGGEEGEVVEGEEGVVLGGMMGVGPDGEDLSMGDVFYESLVGPRVLMSDYGIEGVGRSNYTVYALMGDGVDELVDEDGAGSGLGVVVLGVVMFTTVV